MARFSPPLQSQFPIESLPMSIGHIRAGKGAPTPFFHWQGSYSTFFEMIRAARDDNSPAGASFKKNIPQEIDGQRYWSAVTEQSSEFLANGVSKDAFEAFKIARAKIHADRFLPGALRPMVAGGAWIVPLVLASNPLPSRIRERTKLPPLNIQLGITAMACTDWRAITNSLAPVAHALWEYVQAGGAVTLTVHHCWAFNQPEGQARGVVFSIRAPLTNQAAFATVCSVQCLRALCLLIGQSLSGVPDGRDSMPLAYYCHPSIKMLNGLAHEDAKVIESLKIRT